ncbi:hypothetical protein [Chromobacterium violaceum]|uniref:hypothetical protein n=1 Tax=Chromobacterium violaceum TaxID=536 RepID=UPI0018AF598C|nr:hypothetical protein [Chromobacterium violaceum]
MRKILGFIREKEAAAKMHSSIGLEHSDETIQAVWDKAKIIPNKDGSELRLDCYGAVIRRTDYGNNNSDLGWEVDHIKASNNDGEDSLDNYQPLQWRNNRFKSDNAHPKKRMVANTNFTGNVLIED